MTIIFIINTGGFRNTTASLFTQLSFDASDPENTQCICDLDLCVTYDALLWFPPAWQAHNVEF